MALNHFIRFTQDAGALEKILRLLQSIFQILAAFAPDITSQSRCLLLRRQFALGRRHFRFFKFLDCFRKAYVVLGNVREDKSAENGWQDLGIRTEDVEVVLGVGKWGFMGAYLGCESATFLDAISYWPTPWAETIMLEGNRFWFYSLICSITLSLIDLFWAEDPPAPPPKDRVRKSTRKSRSSPSSPSSSDEKVQKSLGNEVQRKEKEKRDNIKRRIVSDAADLFIPGFVTGWIRTTPAVVGFASTVSTTLGMMEIWDRLK